MHDQEKPSQSAIPGTHERLLEESSKILHAMVVMSNRLGRPMSGDRMDQLLADLAHYPVRGIEWALDNWGRNAKALPVLSDILKLLQAWSLENVIIETCGNCDSGWVRGFKDKAGNDAVKRCSCMVSA